MALTWKDLLGSFEYSVWENRVEPATGSERILRTPTRRAAESPSFQLAWREACHELSALPYAAAEAPGPRVDRIIRTSSGPVRTPQRLDSADFGNELVYCAMGSWGIEDRPDLTRYVKLCGPDKQEIPLSPPHYDLPGGPTYRRIDASKLLLFGCNGRLFRDLPRQKQRRVRDTAVWVTEVEGDGMAVTMVDFAPLAPALSFVCRVFLVQGLSSVTIDQRFVAEGADWQFTIRDGGLEIKDPSDGTGMFLLSSAPLSVEPSTPSGTDARLDVHQVGWSVLVPLRAAGDPAQDAALAALAAPGGFDPLKALVATIDAWRGWAREVRFQCDDPLMEDLINGLALLLKVHEGRHGMHLGTTYQRHTHCWIRDNYLMQRGLWAAGRGAEAQKDVEAFAGYWKANGPALGYHVASRRSWSPQTTAELCSYLVLMARESHRNIGAAPAGAVRDMLRSCADAIATNARGLAGFDGDEAWFWELDPRLFQVNEGAGFNAQQARLPPSEFSVLDNCWLALAALRYAAELESAGGDAGRANRWRAKADAIAYQMETQMWDARRGRYNALLYPDGSRYDAPLVSGMCTPWFWGIAETHPGSFAAGVAACEQELMTPEGIVRGNRDTDVFAGLTPSFHLHALASIGDGARLDRALPALLASLPSSGACWEYASIDCPVTGTDKRRGLDSGVLLAALLRSTVGLDVTTDGFTLRPRLPGGCSRLSFGDMTIRGRTLRIETDAGGTRVSWAGARHDIPPGRTLRWTAGPDLMEVL